MNTKRIFLIVWLTILLSGITIAVITRNSYTEFQIGEIDYNNLIVRLGTQDVKELYDKGTKKYDSLDELYQKSDLVVKVIFEGYREPQYQSVLSTVRVLDVYRGSDCKANDKIFVYEQSYFGSGEYKDLFFVSGCSNVMIKDEEYILFLSNKEFSKEYHQTEKDKKTYLINNNVFGKYNVSSDQTIALLDRDIQYTYSQVAKQEIITTDPEILNLYLAWKADVLNVIQCNNENVSENM